jgi:hypothetical protein
MIAGRGIVNCGISADPRCAQIGESSRVIDPTLMAQSAIWRPMPDSPCLRAGIDVKKQFRVNPGYSDFYGNPIQESGSVAIGAAGPESVIR